MTVNSRDAISCDGVCRRRCRAPYDYPANTFIFADLPPADFHNGNGDKLLLWTGQLVSSSALAKLIEDAVAAAANPNMLRR